jgi:XTP/dITP diphosphohydrolase
MQRLERGTRLVVASHNPGKVWEIKELIAPYGLEAVSAAELGLAVPAETETTFEGNARLKALAAARGSGLPALADDSGLEVEALGGAPGVHSADWAGPARDFSIAMQRVHDEVERRKGWDGGAAPRARFVSVLCLASPGGEHRHFEGKVEGSLVWPPRGGNGFGYDPMFVAAGEQLTFGEMEPAAKYAISHRTRAFERFRRECLGEPEGPPSARPPAHDLEALDAAARNLSTKAELVRFIANLRGDLARVRDARADHDIARYLEALETWLARNDIPDEPRWRTIARALLAASRHTERA